MSVSAPITTATPDALALLANRRSVVAKKLGEPGPTEDQLRRIVEIGLRVPDHGKLAPWRLLVIDKEGQARLGDLYAGLYAAAYPEANEAQIAFERNRPQRAPALIAVVSTPVASEKIPRIEQTLSAGAVCQNLLNAAHATGFAAQWLTEWPAYNAKVREALGFDETAEIAGFIFIGTPSEPPTERTRPAYEDVVRPWTGPGSV